MQPIMMKAIIIVALVVQLEEKLVTAVIMELGHLNLEVVVAKISVVVTAIVLIILNVEILVALALAVVQ